MVVVAVCVAFVGAAAVAGTPRWPAACWSSASDSTVANLTKLYREQDSLGGTPQEWLAQRSLYWEEVRHPLLTALLPDVRWCRVTVCSGDIGVPPSYAVALSEGRFYRFREANAIIGSLPVMHDSSGASDIARLTVLFGFLDESADRFSRRPSLPQSRASRWYGLRAEHAGASTTRYALDETGDSLLRDSGPDWAAAIPEVEFGTIQSVPEKHDGPVSSVLRVPCRINGQTRAFVLSFVRNELYSLAEGRRDPVVFERVSSVR